MASIEDLFRMEEMEAKDLFDALHEFFSSEKFGSYETDPRMNEAERQAVYGLFDSDLSLEERVERALHDDPFCLEALYIDYKLADDLEVYEDLDRIYRMRNELDSFSEYHRFAFFVILSMFADFLFSSSNMSKAMRVLEYCCEKSGEYTKTNVLRLAYIYTGLENGEHFYSLFERDGFSDPLIYILLLITLLKNDMEDRAKEVLDELVSKFPLSAYIASPYELDSIESEEAERILDALDVAREMISSVPYFFEWCHVNMGSAVARA